MATYKAECIRCGAQVGEAFALVGDGEESRLRDHLTQCAGAEVERKAHGVGAVLTRFRLTRIDLERS